MPCLLPWPGAPCVGAPVGPPPRTAQSPTPATSISWLTTLSRAGAVSPTVCNGGFVRSKKLFFIVPTLCNNLPYNVTGLSMLIIFLTKKRKANLRKSVRKTLRKISLPFFHDNNELRTAFYYWITLTIGLIIKFKVLE